MTQHIKRTDTGEVLGAVPQNYRVLSQAHRTLADCTTDCTPGNCEVQHAVEFGYADDMPTQDELAGMDDDDRLIK